MLVRIVYGTETLNAKDLAERLQEALEDAGHDAEATDMSDYSAAMLADETLLLVVTSTYGNGDPPFNARKFLKELQSDQAPGLSHLAFAVLGLGDTTYANFCKCGKDFDAALGKLGGRRILARVDCDGDPEDPFEAWTEALTDLLESPDALESASVPPDAYARGQIDSEVEGLRYEVEVVANRKLTGEESTRDVRHIELAFLGTSPTWEPGDRVSIWPENDPERTRRFFKLTGLSGKEIGEVHGQRDTMAALARLVLELSLPSLGFVERLAALAKNSAAHADAAAQLNTILDGDREQLTRWMSEHDVLDLLETYAPLPLSVDALLALLDPIQPRLYTISSSPAAHDGQIHLTASILSYRVGEQTRRGATSAYICDRMGQQRKLRIGISPAGHFRLPADPHVPMIMVGPGTGVAPFRSFLFERDKLGHRGDTWLFFGARNQSCDALYGSELEQLVTSGTLTRLDLAWSRDQGGCYVQDRLRANADDIFAWLERGAHIYVCGDASKMAPQVRATIESIVADRLGADAAHAYMTALDKGHRYHLDVY